MSSIFPLPGLKELNNFTPEQSKEYIDECYEYFLNNINKKLSFLGQNIICRYNEPVNEMHGGFWHLITESYDGDKIPDEDRTIDFRRTERLSWIPHIINNINSDDLDCWDNGRGIVIWCQRENYMIILGRRDGYLSLVTAYRHRKSKIRNNLKELKKFPDPRKS